MGVPAFFRWLSVRYSKVVINALSEDELEYLYDDFKKDQEDPNEINLLDGDLQGEIDRKIKENNPEFDNLYLDMNGIIHPCTHPPDKPQPKTEVEMFNNIFEYVDKIMKIVKPQRLIYMAVDGVAPRAKMNQQRSRRFRAALDTEERETREAEIRNKWQSEGIKFSGEATQNEGAKFDQNVITPGTEFMYRLSKALQYFVMERLQNNPHWKGIKVIFSDASVPGEGEHKILDFIRSQRCQPGYDANTRHCIYGADADLIMLGLSTHEPHFCILREAFVSNFDKKCITCGQEGHLAADCPTLLKEGVKVRLAKSVSFQYIKLNILREYLYLEFKDMQLPFAFDFERMIDDFVFLCFFVGNDFLPHLPSLDIREGAIDCLLVIYKYQLPALGDYLTKNGEIDFGKVDLIFNDIAKIEEEVFKFKKQQVEKFKNQGFQRGGQNHRGGYNRGGGYQNRGGGQQQRPQHVKYDQKDEGKESVPKEEVKDTVEDFEQKTRDEIKSLKEIAEEEMNKLAAEKMKEVVKKLMDEKNQKIADKYVDKVQFGTEGWKLRYYKEKFHINQQDLEEFTSNIKKSYLEGLQWVYSYYYKGCVSWYWFYPFHYAPFASDLINCDNIDIKFEMGVPATAFEQLMGVFPKQSGHAIPLCYRWLLSDPQSEIIDFYPIYFRLDINGARYAWMGVNLLPFIDRQRLVAAMKKCEQGLTEHEKERNKMGKVYLFFEKLDNSSSGLMQALNQIDFTKVKGVELFPSFKRKDLIGGTVKCTREDNQIGLKIKMPIGKIELEPIDNNQVYQVVYDHPTYERHITKLLEGLVDAVREVEDFEIYHVNRRFFNGENAIRMLERTLGIDTGVSQVYKPLGFQNAHSTYDGARVARPGQSVEDYQNNMSAKRPGRDYQSYDKPGYKRPKLDNNQQQNYGQGRQQQNYNRQQYQQPPQYQQQQQPNYNTNQYQGSNQQYQQQQQQPQYQQQQPQYQQQQYHNQQQPYYQQQQQQYQQYLPPQGQDQSTTLMNLLQQLGQQQAGQPQYQQTPQDNQKNNNRFQGFMDK